MLREEGWRMKYDFRGLIAIAAVGLLGCAQEEPAPTFRSFPPVLGSYTSTQASNGLGILSGRVYAATSEATDDITGLPAGYALLTDGESKITIQVVASSSIWEIPIASGSYRVGYLPMRVPLQITAAKTGLRPRMQTITIPPSGRALLDFAYVGNASDSYLLPVRPLADPWKLNLPRL